MAKRKKPQLPDADARRAEMNEALANMEGPKTPWKLIVQIGIGFAVLWVVAGMLTPYIGYWGLGVAGVLTLIALGFGVYIWRLTRKSSDIMQILKGATDAEGRDAAIAALQAKGDDVMGKLAQAQLVGQEDPKEAMRVLEEIDLEKAPKLLQNDVRAQLGLMYLLHNRAKDARKLADDIKLDAQPQPKQKAMYAAIIAESFARTGKVKEANDLLADYDPDAAGSDEFAEMKPLLYRAQMFAALRDKKRGRARTAMMRLAKLDPNQLGAFLQKGTHPEVKRLAREVLEKEGFVPKQKVQMRRY
ncbi:MAG: hypothetical protein CMN30_19880 [Sandaracinus sp.]|nr:hypothetical protein [Sandaracinus sp.]